MTDYNKKMHGAYSDIKTHLITIITESNVGGDGYAEMDAPVITEIDQCEFTEDLAEETRQFC